MSKSSIEWTDATWNPLTGCNKVSPGCKNCYAEKMAIRLKAMGQPNYRNGFELTLHDHALDTPRKWKSPKTVFVNSMSDVFHKDVPLGFIQEVFRTMRETPQHRYQVLTKRSERLAELSRHLPWPPNVWMGVSVESSKYAWRIDHLRAVPAKVRFLSLEPLLGPLEPWRLNLRGIHWVIVGGESGPGARKMELRWAKLILHQCWASGVPLFVKQLGSVWARENKAKHSKGGDPDEWPEWLRVREFPRAEGVCEHV